MRQQSELLVSRLVTASVKCQGVKRDTVNASRLKSFNVFSWILNFVAVNRPGLLNAGEFTSTRCWEVRMKLLSLRSHFPEMLSYLVGGFPVIPQPEVSHVFLNCFLRLSSFGSKVL